tara:strand:+ start:2089 stop:3111 length:1023 start_codon:yes stop_codon:yes gene_type:complete
MGGKRLATFAIFAAVACLGAWIVYGNIQKTERENAAASQQNDSFAECVSAQGFSGVAECGLQAAQSPYEKTKDWYDLKAQQDMAKWALLMLVVTSVGIVYVAATFQETRKATSVAIEALKHSERNTVAAEQSAQAAEAMANSDRAWLVVEFSGHQQVVPRQTSPSGMHDNPTYFVGSVTFTVANYGRSPAILKCIMAEVYWVPGGFTNGRDIDPASREAFRARATRRPDVDVTPHPPQSIRLVRKPETNNLQRQLGTQHGRELAVRAGDVFAMKATFEWNVPQGVDRVAWGSEDAFFYCLLFYEDIRGQACETSFYKRLGPGPCCVDVSEPLSTAHNYRH